MKLPIPSDWDPAVDGWRCVEIRWPNSPLWTAYLSGWLSQFQRGRIWDETTGSVLDAMATGAEIWSKNGLLRECGNCNEETPPTPLPPDGVGGGVWFDSLGDDMACLDISSLIKLEGGHLWVRDGCCQWVDKGSIGDHADEPITDPPGDDIDPPIAFSACGKANAIVNAIYTVAQACWEGSDLDVWDGVNFVKNAVAPITVKAKYVLEGIVDAFALKHLTYSEAEVFDADSKQQVLCHLVNSLTSDTGALSQDNINAINNAFNQNLGFETAIFGAAANAIGIAQLSDIAMLGQLNDTADCECPETIEVPQTTLVFLANITKTAGDGEVAAALSIGRTKADFTWSGTSSSASTDWQGTQGVDCSGPISDVVVRVQGVSGDNPPTVEWETEPPFTIAPPDFGIAPTSVSVLTSGADYAVFGIHWSSPVTPTAMAHSFKYPGRYAPNPFNLTWYYHILSAQ